jgi:hypothetical protein
MSSIFVKSSILAINSAITYFKKHDGFDNELSNQFYKQLYKGNLQLAKTYFDTLTLNLNINKESEEYNIIGKASSDFEEFRRFKKDRGGVDVVFLIQNLFENTPNLKRIVEG